MIRSSDIKAEIEELTTLELITEAFGEIASKRMFVTRNGVVANRVFLEGLTNLFDEIRASNSNEIKKIASERKQKSKKTITFLSHNGKTVSVLFSANNGLYGPIIKETFDLFKKEILEGKTEITVVGEVGKNLFESNFPGKPYTYFSVSDKEIPREELVPLARHIVQYEEVHFFYGKFQNVVTQKAEVLSIRSNLETTVSGVKEKRKYLFEPNLESILIFFESELFGSVLKQTTEESKLARLGSRVFEMNEATSRIKHEKNKLSILKLAYTHKEINKKQLDSLSGILTIL